MTPVLALLASVAAQPAPPAGDYPTDAVLAAFETTCGDLTSVGVGVSSVTPSGWDLLETTYPESEVGRVLAIMKKSATPREGMIVTQSRAFSRMVAGRRIHALLSQVDFRGTAAAQCQLFDFNDQLGFSRPQAERWIGRSPTSSAVGTNGFWMDWWTPGKTSTQTIVEIEYWPMGSDDKLGIVRSIRLTASTLPQSNTSAVKNDQSVGNL